MNFDRPKRILRGLSEFPLCLACVLDSGIVYPDPVPRAEAPHARSQEDR